MTFLLEQLPELNPVIRDDQFGIVGRVKINVGDHRIAVKEVYSPNTESSVIQVYTFEESPSNHIATITHYDGQFKVYDPDTALTAGSGTTYTDTNIIAIASVAFNEYKLANQAKSGFSPEEYNEVISIIAAGLGAKFNKATELGDREAQSRIDGQIAHFEAYRRNHDRRAKQMDWNTILFAMDVKK